MSTGKVAVAGVVASAAVLTGCGGGQGNAEPIDARITSHVQTGNGVTRSVGENQVLVNDTFLPRDEMAPTGTGRYPIAQLSQQTAAAQDSFTVRTPAGETLLTIEKVASLQGVPVGAADIRVATYRQTNPLVAQARLSGERRFIEAGFYLGGEGISPAGTVTDQMDGPGGSQSASVVQVMNENGAPFQIETKVLADDLARATQVSLNGELAYTVRATSHETGFLWTKRTEFDGYDILDPQGEKLARLDFLMGVDGYQTGFDVSVRGAKVGSFYLDKQVSVTDGVEDSKTTIDLALAGSTPEEEQGNLIRLDAVLKLLQTQVGSGQQDLDVAELHIDQLRFALMARWFGAEDGVDPSLRDVTLDLMSRHDAASLPQALFELGVGVSAQ